MGKRMKFVPLLMLAAVLSFLAYGCGQTIDSLWEYSYTGTPLLYGAEGSDDSLLVIQRGDLFGYADVKGKVVIRPQFRSARPFYEGLAAVEGRDGFGYIDKKGKVVIPLKFYGAADFHNGRALAGTEKEEEGEFVPQYAGVIDIEGNVLKQTRYTKVLGYSDGMTAVLDGFYDLIYLDSDYRLVATFHGDEGIQYRGEFSGGLAPFPRDDGRIIFIDKTGKQAFPGDYYFTGSYSEGLVHVAQEDCGLFGYIDQTGHFKIPPQFKDARPFGDGMAWVKTLDDKWVIIDTNGNEIGHANDLVYGRDRFSEGLCAVRVDKVKKVGKEYKSYVAWGFMDAAGEMVIDFQYDKVTPFKNGIAQVMVNGKIGYIDKTGKYIWEPK